MPLIGPHGRSTLAPSSCSIYCAASRPRTRSAFPTPLDPRIQLLRRTFESRSASAVPRTGQNEAAVALLLRPHEQLELLLIRRAELDGDPWSGHIALPGGRRSHADANLLATARRETEEETGIPLGRVGTFVGALDELTPSTPRLPPIVIAPFVLAVPPDTDVQPNTAEVQAAFWVSVEALRDERAASQITVELETEQLRLPALAYGDYVVWGLTYRILQQFLSLL
jgi:8-oxo-dGTP pyrophosphatase MutT (NUDIX family)